MENPQHIYQQTTSDIEIKAKPFFIPEKSSVEHSFYYFAYTITIKNMGPDAMKILRRKWIIRDGKGREEVVQGEGVVGEKPMIKSGEFFTYTSFCPLKTSTGSMRGKFYLENQHGERLWVDVPVFFLRRPESFLQ
jgi:ApaG protein